MTRTTVGSFAGYLILGSALASAQPLGTSFTYQGQLIRAGTPVTAACDFQFMLLNAPSGGMQQGPTQTSNDVPVSDGVFTVVLDFGDQFHGGPRWLQTAVKCGTEVSFVTLQPRQALAGTPYALGVRPGTSIEGSVAGAGESAAALRVTNTSSEVPVALFAKTTAPQGFAIGVRADSMSPEGAGLVGRGFNGGIGVSGESPEGIGVQGTSSGRAAVLGVSGNPVGSGVEGRASGGNAAGVFGVNDSGPGAWGRSVTGFGVFGESPAFGVRGATTDGAGVYGSASGIGAGVFGQGLVGVIGQTNGGQTSQGIRGENQGSNTVGYAGVFNGRVDVVGTLSKLAGAFKIDHPIDPANKYLRHSFIESPDMKNLYDGVVTLDENGEALVELPAYFEALNRDFRYQLTCIGGHAPVFIADEIEDNRFRIAGGWKGLKVSWLVTGVRHDPYAEENRIVVEENKPESEQGTYMYPDGYGMPRSMGMAALLGKVPLDGGPLPTRPGASASE